MPVSYYVSAVVVTVAVVLGPVLLAVLLVRRTSVPARAIWVGVLTFAVAQLFTRLPLMSAVQAGAGGWVLAHPVLWLVLLCLSAGVFEEGARWLGFRFLLPGEPDRRAVPVGAGVGHGGLEAVVLVGVTVGTTALTYAVLGSGQLPSGSLPPEAVSALQTQRDALAQLGAAGQLAALWERVVAMGVHVVLSVLVFRAVRDRRLPLLVLAVLLHAGFNAVPLLLQPHLEPGLATTWLLELALTVAAVVLAAVVWLVVRARTAEPAPATVGGAGE
nr:YhfC family glutamic-type intramembrane protease [Auraticoccus cholistanensis]